LTRSRSAIGSVNAGRRAVLPRTVEGVRGVVPAVVVTLVLAACSADDAGPSSPTSTSEPDEAAPFVTGPVVTGPVVTGPDVTEPPDLGPGRATVTDVEDGDTLDVRFADGRYEQVRVIGINSPEDGECLADEATDLLEELVGGRAVTLRRDRTDRDQYGRLLRYVVLAGLSVGEAMVESGLAISRAYPPDTAQQAALDAAQARAQDAERGRWAPDACGRPSSAAVEVGDVLTDPPGDESQALNDEWVEVVNRGDRAVELTGWGVQDESSSHRFSFPAGYRLSAGASVRIHSGEGRATAADLYWGQAGSAIWNNDGDTVFLIDPAGNVHDQRSV
jgi:micrococcal nuclease